MEVIKCHVSLDLFCIKKKRFVRNSGFFSIISHADFIKPVLINIKNIHFFIIINLISLIEWINDEILVSL
jgi:hypothetical protein